MPHSISQYVDASVAAAIPFPVLPPAMVARDEETQSCVCVFRVNLDGWTSKRCVFQSEFGRLDLKKGQNPGGFLTHLLTVTPANFDSKQCSILQQFARSVTSDLRPGYLLARP